MATLLMMRHGQSEWNRSNRFTGWVDVPLSETGVKEAVAAGELIKNISLDVLFTSTLIRARMTLMLAMMNHASRKVPVMVHREEGREKEWSRMYDPEDASTVIPVYSSWHLNERMYGDLQGLNKADTIKKYGEEQVKIWRRSFDVAPPNGESLEMTAQRTLPYFNEEIVPLLKKGKNVFICAHGNSLRSIIMQLDRLSPTEVVELEIETGFPIVYEYQNGLFEKK